MCDRFGNQLPFLFKVLAAAEPLSIQAHPDREQARRGWARENEEGIPLDAPRRNYRDLNHKPELVCAVTPFTVLKGFRPADELAALLDPIAGTELKREVGRLAREPGPVALRALFTRLMTLDDDEKAPLLGRTRQRARRPPPAHDEAWGWVGRLLERYPEDIGVLGPLYLNLVTLAPGEALFLSAGELHAYLEGTALELMANSDNVLRGGLTPKHVDVPELLSVLAFDAPPLQVLRPESASAQVQVYRTPAREFELELLTTDGGGSLSLPEGEPSVLLGLEGDLRLEVDGRSLPLGRGRSVFVPATASRATLAGGGRLARAHVPA